MSIHLHEILKYLLSNTVSNCVQNEQFFKFNLIVNGEVIFYRLKKKLTLG